eukprot:TRINITY_DN84774_c0_g1_i3.p1 TRINITY_DN84774_c0_g1~~TRINITY_DN84774_c0_g1_i3.p1  ORF type:complete len:271 (+),score=41.04 TRINITY_DN84774_c0_g1_i3:114-926(+)
MAMANGVAASMTGQRAGGDVDPDPGGSSEALQPPLRSFRFQSKFDRFKGRWLRGYEGESVATVYSAGVLVWAEGYGGARSQLEVLGPNTVTMELEGQRYFGTMGQPPAEPTQLLWSDGEIWSPEVEPSLWETYSGNWVQADGSCAQCGSICRGVLTWATGYGVTESTLDLTSKGRKTILVLRQGNDVVTAQLSDNLEDPVPASERMASSSSSGAMATCGSSARGCRVWHLRLHPSATTGLRRAPQGTTLRSAAWSKQGPAHACNFGHEVS